MRAALPLWLDETMLVGRLLEETVSPGARAQYRPAEFTPPSTDHPVSRHFFIRR
ncbi:hypothetical protein PUR57_02595 [Streptomyces sp. JV176]|uniref:hypothetical protein n=1 Tax=Streptomyces sp. JV176 TaxID=858630 RepID=UPI002E787C38|nr:hypothetical protein [Streptomyces sp. JV176]MEE1797582.1 hypothetical protein [Streptomyces sp. JV176]